jgi:hypothetical protein
MKKFAALTILIIAHCALAQTTYGRLDFSLQNAQGQAISGAQINVYTQSTCGAPAGALATLYSTALGPAATAPANIPLTQPLITDGFGHAFAYTAQGCVTITYNSPYTGLLTYADQNVIAGTSISGCGTSTPCTIPQGGTGATSQLGANGSLGIPGPVFNIADPFTSDATPDPGGIGSCTGKDNSAAIQSVINAACAVQGEIFIPPGVWDFKTPLTAYCGVAPTFAGANYQSSILEGCATSPQTQGALTVANAAPATPCTSNSCDPTTGQPSGSFTNFGMHDLTILANNNYPDNLDLLSGAWFSTRDTLMLGAQYCNYFLMFTQQGQMDKPMAEWNAFYNISGFASPTTQNGLCTNVYNTASETVNNVTVTTPIFMGLTGSALSLNYAAGDIFNTCQFSNDASNLSIQNSGPLQFNSCLFEGGGRPGLITLGTVANYIHFNNSSFLNDGGTTISGKGTHIKGGLAALPITISSTARATVLEGAAIGSQGSNITDNAPDTQYHANIDSATGLIPCNFPADKITAPYSTDFGTVATEPERLQGCWQSNSGATVNLDPGLLYAQPGYWTANFCGTWENVSTGYYNMPNCYEFTVSSPTKTLSDGKVITISATTGQQFTMTVSGSQRVAFIGSIDFNPLGNNGANSIGHYFNTNVSAPGFDVNGTALATGNLADWTNSGVANGSIPTWNSTTSKWTPSSAPSGSFTALSGDCTSTSTGGATTCTGLFGHAIASLTSGFLQWNGTGFVWGSSTGPTLQTNGVNNSSQTALNFLTSSVNACGLIWTPSNPSAGGEQGEITGTYTCTITSGQILAGLGYTPANCTAGLSANNCAKLNSSGLLPLANQSDYPAPFSVPAANCVSGSPGSAWSTTIAPSCRAGTYNLGGNLPFADGNTAQFEIPIPADWDSSANAYARLNFTTGANTSGTIIFQIQLSCYTTGNTQTDDQAFQTAQVFPTKTATAVNFANSVTLTLNSTSLTGCAATGGMIVKITRNTDTAASVVPVTKAVITLNRALVNEAQ